MDEGGWPLWQIVVLILVLLAAGIYVASGLLGPGPQPAATRVAAVTSGAAVTPTATATRPLILTNTPTSTAAPTRTPAPPPTPTATPTVTPTPSPTPIVVNPRLKALGRLETAQYTMQVIVDLEREPTNLWQEAFGTNKLLLIAEGEVVAGFDLTKVKEEDIQVQGTRVRLTLPPPEILHHAVDEQKTYVYERQTGFLVRPDETLETEARRAAQQRLLDWAEEHAIYDKAEEFGVLYMESFLRSLGFTDVTVEVRDAAR